MTYNMIKTSSFLHQALHYSQMYNFTLNHDYKFKTRKSKMTFEYYNLKRYMYFECFKHMEPFLWNILKFTKKLKQFGEHLIKEKYF